MIFTHAITRKPGINFADGLTPANLGTPSYDLITEQHSDYVDTLKQNNLTVTELEPLIEHPDAYFVEDPAIVTPRVAVITLPGAPTRRGEQAFLKQHLEQFREIAQIQPPGTVDGGDILMVNDHFYIGVSARTNSNGAQQLGQILESYGHSWTRIAVQNGLHLKSDVNYIGNNTLLISKRYAHLEEFDSLNKIIVSEKESYAANTLRLNNCLIIPKGFPDTKDQIDRMGCDIVELDVSEVQKMDGGLTCLSLRF